MRTGARTLAGYTLGDRLASDIYGELYAATGEGARQVQVRVVAATLAGDRAFADHLTSQAAPRLHTFAHRAVIGTVLVARDGRELLVVTEPVHDARSVVDLLAARGGGGLPARVVAAISRAVIDGLASAHAAGLVHGAVHPRSVLLDRDGAVLLTDLAVGYAAMSAAAAGSDAMPLRGLAGFVSPEVALGDTPTAAADVYGAGALMVAMMTGDAGAAGAGALPTTTALERLVRRALDTDLTRRFASAVELQEDLADALEDDGVAPASPAELAALWAETTAALSPRAAGPAIGGAGDRTRDDGLEDLLASLDGTVEVSRSRGSSAPAVAVTGRKLRNTASLDAVLFDLDDEPPPAAEVALGSVPGVARAVVVPATVAPPDDAPEPAVASVTAVPSITAAPPSAAVAPPAATRPGTRAVVAAPEVIAAEAPTLRRRGLAWLWVAIIAAGGVALAVGLTRQKDELTAAEQDARARKEAARAEREALERRLLQAQADPGALRVRSRPSGAGVWLLLGRAPFESISLATDQAWELRAELEGHLPRELRVGAAQWQGSTEARRASLDVALAPGAAVRPLAGIPAQPPADQRAGVPGAGRLTVTSSPPGAAVWLLVGVTDEMELRGVEAGRDYELKVTRDGHLPGFVRFAAEDWRAGGDPALPLPAAPKKAVLERTVDLVAAPRRGRGR